MDSALSAAVRSVEEELGGGGPVYSWWSAVDAAYTAHQLPWLLERFPTEHFAPQRGKLDAGDVLEFLEEKRSDAQQATWRGSVAAYEGLLTRICGICPDFAAHWNHWDKLADLYVSVGDATKAAELRLAKPRASWQTSSTDLRRDFNALMSAGSFDAARALVNQALALVRTERWSDIETVYCWAQLAQATEAAAELWELYLRSNRPCNSASRYQNASAWLRAVKLWELAGDRQRAVRIATEIGRHAKAVRLNGGRAFELSEADFPRGLPRSAAIADALRDQAGRIEAFLRAGDVDEALRIAGYSWDYVTGAARALRAFMSRGLADKVPKALVEGARLLQERLKTFPRQEAAIRKAAGAGYMESFHALSCLEELKMWNEVLANIEGFVFKTGNVSARAWYYLGDFAKAAAATEQYLAQYQTEYPSMFIVDPSYAYTSSLGLAFIFEEAGDTKASERVLLRAEQQLRSRGLWQLALSLYYDAGRLDDMERVAREEDELECAVKGYEAVKRHEDAARIYQDMAAAGKTVTRGRSASTASGWEPATLSGSNDTNDSSEPSCPACAQPVKPHWRRCPRPTCRANLQTQCPQCKEPVEIAWEECPACLAVL